MCLRVAATESATAGLIRLDQLVAALARNRLWLTDAYYAGTTSYVQALRAAAQDGVDVRLLVPNGTDIPLLRPLSRAGSRPLLEAGVRIFEWKGTMLHAKTAAADGHWARVGSTNLNIASWFGNCELDAVIEDDAFAAEMEQAYLEDLANATEVVLDEKRKVRAPGEPLHRHPSMTSGGGNAGRAAVGAARIGHAIGAVFTDRRVIGPLKRDWRRSSASCFAHCQLYSSCFRVCRSIRLSRYVHGEVSPSSTELFDYAGDERSATDRVDNGNMHEPTASRLSSRYDPSATRSKQPPPIAGRQTVGVRGPRFRSLRPPAPAQHDP